MGEREAYIEKEWLTVQNYQFKILVMIAVLAENHLAYRGKLKDMCEFLGVCSNTNNKNKIKEAIEILENKGDIKTLKEGQTWTLTLSVKAERKPKVVKIRNAWIAAIQNYKSEDKNNSVAWENVLKVLVYLIADKKDIKTYKEIADNLNLDTKIIKRSIAALDNIELNDISVKRKLAWFKNNQDEFRVIGQRIDVMYDFEK